MIAIYNTLYHKYPLSQTEHMEDTDNTWVFEIKGMGGGGGGGGLPFSTDGINIWLNAMLTFNHVFKMGS